MLATLVCAAGVYGPAYMDQNASIKGLICQDGLRLGVIGCIEAET